MNIKYTSFFLIFLAGWMPGSSQNISKEPVDKISSVEVFSGKAIVKRSVRVTLNPGKNFIQIRDLSPRLDNSSVRLETSSSSDLKIMGIYAESQFSEDENHKGRLEAENNLKNAESNLRKLTDEYNSLRSEEKLLMDTKLGRIPEDDDEYVIRVDPASWKTTLDFIQTSLKANHDRTDKILSEIDNAREDLSLAMFLWEKVKSRSKKHTKSISLELDAKKAGEYSFVLSYHIQGASWYPVYFVNYKEGISSSLELKKYAFVKNETGEDWNFVNLEFSTSSVDTNIDLPEIRPWIVESVVRPAPVPYAKRKMDMSNDFPAQEISAAPKKRMKKESKANSDYYIQNQAVVVDERASRRSKKTENELQAIQTNIQNRDSNLLSQNYEEALEFSEKTIRSIQRLKPTYRSYLKEEEKLSEEIKKRSLNHLENQSLIGKLISPHSSADGFPYLYKSKGKESILSDGSYSKIFLGSEEYPAQLIWETNPSETPSVYSLAKVSYTGKDPILAGPITIYKGKDYLGETKIENVSPKENLFIPLGIEQDVEVVRRKEEFREKSGFLKSEFSFYHKIVIKLHNKKKKEIVVNLLERIPVSKQSNIQIDFSGASHKSDKEDKDFGLYRYPVKLSPSSKDTVEIKYKITHPDSMITNMTEKGEPQW